MNQMMKVNLINDIVQIIKDHLIEDLVYQTSYLKKKRYENLLNKYCKYYFIKFINEFISNTSIDCFRSTHLL